MPYIKQRYRDVLDPAIGELANRMEEACPQLYGVSDLSGPLNYSITRLLLESLSPKRYDDFNRIIGILECVKQEVYRKAIVLYEEEKIKSEGDIDWSSSYG